MFPRSQYGNGKNEGDSLQIPGMILILLLELRGRFLASARNDTRSLGDMERGINGGDAAIFTSLNYYKK